MTAPTNDKVPDKLLEHSYDGIQEYDNPMPRWWLITFAGTIVFSVIYYFNIGPIGNGKGRIADYEADMKAFAAAHPAPSGDISPDQLKAILADHEKVEAGKTVFATNCASCHRADGGGLIGPNLTDAYWLHGGQPVEIYKTVVNGVLEKGMPNWGKLLKPDQVQNVVAYVVSLKGSNPANPKAPQGTEVTP